MLLSNPLMSWPKCGDSCDNTVCSLVDTFSTLDDFNNGELLSRGKTLPQNLLYVPQGNRNKMPASAEGEGNTNSSNYDEKEFEDDLDEKVEKIFLSISMNYLDLQNRSCQQRLNYFV